MRKYIILPLIFFMSVWSTVWAVDLDNLSPSQTKDKINRIQDSVPSFSVPDETGPKWFVGTVLTNLFDSAQQIKNDFIAAFEWLSSVPADTILKWDSSEGAFTGSSITDDGANITLNNPVTINGDTRVNGAITANSILDPTGNPFSGGKFEDGSDSQDAVYTWAWKWNVGIGTNNPSERLEVNGNIAFWNGSWNGFITNN